MVSDLFKVILLTIIDYKNKWWIASNKDDSNKVLNIAVTIFITTVSITTVLTAILQRYRLVPLAHWQTDLILRVRQSIFD